MSLKGTIEKRVRHRRPIRFFAVVQRTCRDLGVLLRRTRCAFDALRVNLGAHTRTFAFRPCISELFRWRRAEMLLSWRTAQQDARSRSGLLEATVSTVP